MLEHFLHVDRSLPQLFGRLSTKAVNCALVAKQLLNVLPCVRYNRPYNAMRSSCKTVFLQSAFGLDGFTWRLLAAHQGNQHTLLHHWRANPALLRLLFLEVGQVRCLATQCLHGLYTTGRLLFVSAAMQSYGSRQPT